MPKVTRKITHYKKQEEEEEESEEEEISEDDENDEDFEEKKPIKKVKTVKTIKKDETKVETLPNGEALEKIVDTALSDKQKETVQDRLKSFEKLYEEGDAIDWFNELCFCLLTANSKVNLHFSENFFQKNKNSHMLKNTGIYCHQNPRISGKTWVFRQNRRRTC